MPKQVFDRHKFSVVENIQYSFDLLIEAGLNEPKNFELILRNQPRPEIISIQAEVIQMLSSHQLLIQKYFDEVLEDTNDSYFTAWWLCKSKKYDLLNVNSSLLNAAKNLNARDRVILKKNGCFSQENLEKLQMLSKNKINTVINNLQQIGKAGLANQANFDLLIKHCAKKLHLQDYTLNYFRVNGFLDQTIFEKIIKNNIALDLSDDIDKDKLFGPLKKSQLLLHENIKSLLKLKYICHFIEILENVKQLTQESFDLLRKTEVAYSKYSHGRIIGLLAEKNLYQKIFLENILKHGYIFSIFLDANIFALTKFFLENMNFFIAHLTTRKDKESLVIAFKSLAQNHVLNLKNCELLLANGHIAQPLAEILTLLKPTETNSYSTELQQITKTHPSNLFNIILILQKLTDAHILDTNNLRKILLLGDHSRSVVKQLQQEKITQSQFDVAIKISMIENLKNADTTSPTNTNNCFFRFFGSQANATGQRVRNHPLGNEEVFQKICGYVRS